MKILIFYQYFLAPGQPGGSRFNEMTRLWTEAGHDVTVIAGTVNYTTGERPARFAGRWVTKEREGHVTVLRCHVPATYNTSYLGRMWAFFGFTLSSVTAALRVERPDVVIATSPPLVTAIPGWIAARVRHRAVPYIFEIRDLWPESAVSTGVLRPTSLLTRALYALERWACRTADVINVLTPAFRDDIVRRGLAVPEKIVQVPNGADVDEFTPGRRDNAVRRELGWGDRFVVLYAGAHGRANAIGQLVDAAERLVDRPDILIATVGDGPERGRWQEEGRRRGLSNIVFLGPQPKERMAEFVQASDVGAAVLQANPTFRTVYPNKVFDYMACGRPTLLAIDGVARALVCEQARAGIFVKPEQPADIAAGIRFLADHPAARQEMSARGREWVVANQSRRALAEDYLKVMDGVVAGNAGPAVSRAAKRTLYRRGGKRAIDLVVASALLVLAAPVLAITALIVRLGLGSPVLFTQKRPGLHGQPFVMFKFRTMKDLRDEHGRPRPDAERLTRLGGWLRRLSLDELPELLNVVRGEMSLIGPRPLLMQYLERYTPEQARRHDVRPGITGLAQVSGRNALAWPQRFALDVAYVDRCGLTLDAKIALLTVWKLLTREGIDEPGRVSVTEFMGGS